MVRVKLNILEGIGVSLVWLRTRQFLMLQRVSIGDTTGAAT
jgi:hypothetical protein